MNHDAARSKREPSENVAEGAGSATPPLCGPDLIRESFCMDSGNVSLENDFTHFDDDDLIQIHGKKFHLYDEETHERRNANKGFQKD